MNRLFKGFLIVLISLLLCSCQKNDTEAIVPQEKKTGTSQSAQRSDEIYREFSLNQVLESDEGMIHYNLYVPDSYDGTVPFSLFITLPGYEGLYFQGIGENLKSEDFAFEAQKYDKNMIVAAPQLEDWNDLSAKQTNALTEFLLSKYSIDHNRVYLEGFSAGGETASQAVSLRPDLYTAYLQVNSKWDGTYEPIVKAKVPVYLAIGRNDEYYGSQPSINVYQELYTLYQNEGLTPVEINQLLVLDVKEKDYYTSRNFSNEHAGGNLYAFDSSIMNWLFSKQKSKI